MEPNNRILITGITGFVGKNLYDKLSSLGFEVLGISRQNLKDPEIIHCDLTSKESTVEALSKIPDNFTVIHCAALAHSKDKTLGQSYSAMNIAITQNLIDAVQARSSKFIFLSSIAVYGMDGRDYSVGVEDELKPSTDYGKSKLECEEIIKSSKVDDYIILRLGPVFDESNLDDVKKRVFFPGQEFLKHRIFPTPSYSLCHINTAVSKIVELVKDDSPKPLTLNIADPQPYTQKQLSQQFAGIEIPVPAALISPICSFLSVLPFQKSYAIQCLLGKLFKNNIYS